MYESQVAELLVKEPWPLLWMSMRHWLSLVATERYRIH